MGKAILGISAFYHDSAASIIQNGKIIAAAQEERFTRKKHDEGFPVNAIKYCLEEAGIDPMALDCVVFYDKPYIKFERLLETYHAFAPKGLLSFINAIPVWLKDKLFMKSLINDTKLAKCRFLQFVKENLSGFMHTYTRETPFFNCVSVCKT